MSNFNSDLNQEQILGEYLDEVYLNLNFKFSRQFGLDEQHKGNDVIIRFKDIDYYIDEKAQLTYLNKSLGTFAFEIGCYFGLNSKPGWLFDNSKITTHYFLVTDIFTKVNIKKLAFKSDILSLKIISVDRKKLREYYSTKGFNEITCKKAEEIVRKKYQNYFERVYFRNDSKLFSELCFNKSGNEYFVLSNQIYEKPFNLVSKLDDLLYFRVAKRLK